MRKRAFRGLLAGAALLAAGLAATSSGFAQSAKLSIGLSGMATELPDPILGSFMQKYYTAQVFDYLVGADPDGNLSTKNGLATSWQASPDGLRWTFKLRNDAVFQNGVPVTAEDVKFSLVRAMGTRSTTGYAGMLRDEIASIDAPAKDEVIITLKRPYPFLPDALSRVVSSEGMIVPKAYIEEHGDDYFGTHPIGSGPYKIAELVPGSRIVLEAQDRHWRSGVPRYKSIVIRIVPEETTRIAMLRQGQLDIIDVSPERVSELREDGFQIHVKKDAAIVNCWWIEPWQQKPVGDRRVREALSMAINRQEIADTLFSGSARPAAIPQGFSWSFPEAGLEVTPDLQYKFDPVAAKKLLAEAGYPNGFPMTVYTAPLPGFPEARDTAEALVGYWQNIGLAPKLVVMDYSGFRKIWFDRSDPGALVCYNQANRGLFGAYAALTKFARFDKPSGFIHDEEVARLLDVIGNDKDEESRNANLNKLFRRMRAETVDIPLLNDDSPYAASKTLPKWETGSISYDLNLDQLIDEHPVLSSSDHSGKE